MSIRVYSLNDLRTMSKLRGRLGKHGNITHSIDGYREFQEELGTRLKALNFSIPSEFFALGAVFYISKNKRGRANDVDDLIGAVQDVIVRYKFIQDDSWKHIPRIYGEGCSAPSSGLLLTVFRTRLEMIEFLQGYETFIPRYMPSL